MNRITFNTDSAYTMFNSLSREQKQEIRDALGDTSQGKEAYTGDMFYIPVQLDDENSYMTSGQGEPDKPYYHVDWMLDDELDYVIEEIILINENKDIKIVDWIGNELYVGPYDDKQVDVVLNANRCACSDDDRESCEVCDGTGYFGDFEVMWCDESDKDDCNVYEYINY